jgi:hypothetical protein
MRDTLVLNASFEPLSTVTLNRAVVLVLQDKAVVEQAHPEIRMRGAAVDIPAPRVIRLCRYVRVPFRRQAPWSRRGVLVRDRHKCAYCGRRATTVDHVVPRAQGGQDSWLNTVASGADSGAGGDAAVAAAVRAVARGRDASVFGEERPGGAARVVGAAGGVVRAGRTRWGPVVVRWLQVARGLSRSSPRPFKGRGIPPSFQEAVSL